MGISTERGGLAFGLTCAAGLSTTIGAAVVFNKWLVQLANSAFLAASLSFAAGVMLYVSFVEIFFKSQDAFVEAGESEKQANLYATVCFFSGVIFGNFLDWLVHRMNGDMDHFDVTDVEDLRHQLEQAEAWKRKAARVEELRHEFEELEAWKREWAAQGSLPKRMDEMDMDEHVCEAGTASDKVIIAEAAATGITAAREGASNPSGDVHELDKDGALASDKDSQSSRRLVKMGLMTALAIGIHNLPEGLATFVGTLDDPAVGVGLAVAIAIHNIPEGLCVAIPIYYATHDRWQAFKWAFISGISEPIGAGLGWAILYRVIDDTVYGVVFGLVGGMMVNICIHELLPTAFRYDPGDRLTTKSFIAGMAIMALSLVLFQVA